ncbi:MAG: hypothetical protein J2P37_03440 [Ktedonobacteraceae bacterium]|nr:hypothetical protein [Ktedonobacteraceae bacterium]MBO0789783.1 hypothetical protein [Ktedonobacteraceae bacterium]
MRHHSRRYPEPQEIRLEASCEQCGQQYVIHARSSEAARSAVQAQWECPSCKHKNITRFNQS